MDLSAMFTNDQIAVMGCFAGLAVCGLVAAITFHFGPAGKISQHTTAESLSFPAKNRVNDTTDSRKAA